MFNHPSIAEFIQSTFINTGHKTAVELRNAGLGDVIDGKADIDTETAEKLSQELTGSKMMWLNLQREYEASHNC